MISNLVFFFYLGCLFVKFDIILWNNNDIVFLIELKNCKKMNKWVCYFIIY